MLYMYLAVNHSSSLDTPNNKISHNYINFKCINRRVCAKMKRIICLLSGRKPHNAKSPPPPSITNILYWPHFHTNEYSTGSKWNIIASNFINREWMEWVTSLTSKQSLLLKYTIQSYTSLSFKDNNSNFVRVNWDFLSSIA